MGQILPVPEEIRGTDNDHAAAAGLRRNFHCNFMHYAAHRAGRNPVSGCIPAWLGRGWSW